MFSYFAYGIGIRSELCLPELLPWDGCADVEVRFGEGRDQSRPITDCDNCFLATSDQIGLAWDNVGSFLIENGSRITIEPAPEVDESVLRLFVLGRVMATLLHQRGRLVLHASGVSMDGGAVAFLGGRGWGKSTTAAALYACGHTVVADDALAVQFNDLGVAMAFPGFPQLKLWPEAAASLGDAVETLPRVHPDFEKRQRRVAQGFSQSSLPLRRVYVLDEGEVPAIEPMSPQSAFVELLRHSHGVRLLRGTGTTASHFQKCAQLADSVSVSFLKRPRSLPRLQDLAMLIRDDVNRGA